MPVKKSHRYVEFARELRRESTPAERALWRRLRMRPFLQYKFRRQQVIGTNIVDFVSFKMNLVIELDGAYHQAPGQKKQDDMRTGFLNESKFTVVRFTNDGVMQDMPAVLNRILEACRELHCNSEYHMGIYLMESASRDVRRILASTFLAKPSPLAGEGAAPLGAAGEGDNSIRFMAATLRSGVYYYLLQTPTAVLRKTMVISN